MEAAPLASLSLTHVHYVRAPFPLSLPLLLHFLIPTHTRPKEPSRPHILPMRLARARSSNALRNLCYPDMVDARSRDPTHVRGTNGLRGAQFSTQEINQGREAETYVR